MRELATLLILIALAVPFGDAGAVPSQAPRACDVLEEIHGDVGLAEGMDGLAPSALASLAPPGLPSAGDGSRRTLPVPPRRSADAAVEHEAGATAAPRRDTAWRAALGPALRVYPAHRSTAPPRMA